MRERHARCVCARAIFQSFRMIAPSRVADRLDLIRRFGRYNADRFDPPRPGTRRRVVYRCSGSQSTSDGVQRHILEMKRSLLIVLRAFA